MQKIQKLILKTGEHLIQFIFRHISLYISLVYAFVLSTKFFIGYGDGSKYSGYFDKDTVMISGLMVKNQRFAEVTSGISGSVPAFDGNSDVIHFLINVFII